MSIPAFDMGDLLRLGNSTGANPDQTVREAFTSVEGLAVDPTAVFLEVHRPDGTALAYSWPTLDDNDGLLERESTGRFYYDVAIDNSGRWGWIFTGTGSVQTSEQGQFYVRHRE